MTFEQMLKNRMSVTHAHCGGVWYPRSPIKWCPICKNRPKPDSLTFSIAGQDFGVAKIDEHGEMVLKRLKVGAK